MSLPLTQVLESAGRPRVLVVGDLMLDRYVWGEARRISGEGPIPILEVKSEEDRPGGAGNVMASLSVLRARVTACGVVGEDKEGDTLRRMLKARRIDCAGLLRVPGRPTTVKTRYIGYVQSAHRGIQQMLRVDRENLQPIDEKIETRLMALLDEVIPSQQAVVLTDYDKGLLTERLLRHAVSLARAHKIPVITDPKLARPYSVYRGSTLLKPNRNETQAATGIALRDRESTEAAARALLKKADLKYVLISLDRDGMYLAGRNMPSRHIPSRPKGEVVDISGAGDMVVSVMALMLACGADATQAAMIANTAAGIEVTKIGAAPVSRAEILEDLARDSNINQKVKTLDEAVTLARETQRRNGKVVWTNGCFDIFHIGHYEYLKYAREQGDLLIVGLNSDASVRRVKGPNRPITPQAERARLLAALDVVDCLVIYDDDTPVEAIRAVKPDVLVKGGDYRSESEVVGWEIVKAYGGKIALAPLVQGASTTNIVKRVLELYGKG